jgi:hypothetical protein
VFGGVGGRFSVANDDTTAALHHRERERKVRGGLKSMEGGTG